MEQHVGYMITTVLNKFFRGDPTSLQDKPENDLIDIGVTFITQVMLGKFRRKRMRPYLMQLLDIPILAGKLAEWRCSNAEDYYDYMFEGNILHLACESYDKAFIRHVIEKCGKELASIPNYHGILPITMIKHNHRYKDVYEVLKYFKDNGEDLTQLKNQIVDLYDIKVDKYHRQTEIASKKTMREIIRFCVECQLLTPDDVKRIEVSFKGACDINYWRLNKKEGKKFPNLDKQLMYFFTAVVKAQPPRKEEWFSFMRDNHLLQFFLNSQMELLDALIRNRFTDEDFEEIIAIQFNWMSLRSTRKINFLVTYMPLLRNNQATIDCMSYNHDAYSWIADLKLHKYDIPEEYYNALKPYIDSWIYGPISSNHEKTEFQFDIQKLPSDLIAQVLGFVPYKSIRAFSLTCKKFSKFVDKNLLIWQSLTQKYFPLDCNDFSKTKNEASFLNKFKNKFVCNEIQRLPVDSKRGFLAIEVTQNFLIWTTPDDFGVFDTENYSTMKKEHSSGYDCCARLFNDVLFVKSLNKVETYSKYDLRKISSFDIPISQRGRGYNYAVNDRYLFTDDFCYDLQEGEVAASFPRIKLSQCVIRNNICYGYSGSNLCVLDPRVKASLVATRDLDFSVSENVAAINAYDNQIYLAHAFVEIFDVRMMSQSRQSQLSLSRNKVIDLVSMNVWTAKAVWDLTDLEWSINQRSGVCPELETGLAVCNGKHIIYSEGYNLCARPLSGTQYFPYADFRE